MMTCRFLIHIREWEDNSSHFSETTNADVFFVQMPVDDERNDNAKKSWPDEIRTDSLFNVQRERENDSESGDFSSCSSSRV